MSRIGRMPITIPAGVDVKIEDKTITVKGPKGTLTRTIESRHINVEQNGAVLNVVRDGETGEIKAQHGLYRALIANMVNGVTKEFEKALIINGVGYKATVQGNKLVLNIGYSHPIEMEAPEGISFACPTQTEIVVKGIDKELVGQTAANIRAKRVVEPYHAYGVRYKTETVIMKEGKTNK